jgi:hypothetical protein
VRCGTGFGRWLGERGYGPADVALGGVGGVVGAESHSRAVRAVTWHVEAAADGF